MDTRLQIVYTVCMATQLITIRLDETLLQAVDGHVQSIGLSRTDLVSGLLRALVEGRLAVLGPGSSRLPAAFLPGVHQDNPVEVSK